MSNAKFEPMPCYKLHGQCFANKGGFCMVLTDTWFGKKECPFYATQDEVDAARWRAKQRLIRLNLTYLDRKYKE